MSRRHVIAAAAAAWLAAPAPAAEPGNVCEAQIRAYVKRNFGTTVTEVEFRYEDQQSSPGEPMLLSQALASAAECPGFYFFEVIGDEFTCERQARIGHAPTLVIFRSRGDGC